MSDPIKVSPDGTVIQGSHRARLRVSDLRNGSTFIYHGSFYRATKEWRNETSQRYCECLAFEANGEWHTHSTNVGDWFNIYCCVQLAKIVIVAS